MAVLYKKEKSAWHFWDTGVSSNMLSGKYFKIHIQFELFEKNK